MLFGKHALVENAGDQDVAALPAIEHDMLPMFHPAQTRTDILATPPQRGIVRERVAAGLQAIQILTGLRAPPLTHRVCGNFEQIAISPAGKSCAGHG